MKRITLHIILFTIPVILLVFLFPHEKKQVYAGLKDDCENRANWMYQRIYENPLPVDIAFIGSSRTENSLNERLIEYYIPEFQTLNFAYCRYGRNLHYRLIKDLIEEKQVKAVVLEVRQEENPYSHPVGAYFMENDDLLTSYPLFNKDWLTDWTTAFQFRLQLAQEALWHKQAQLIPDSNGYGFYPNYTIPDLNEIEQEKAERQNGVTKGSLKRKMENTYPYHYLKKIAKLCEENNVRLMFLYLPSYGVQQAEPTNAEFYQQHGHLLIPPDSILQKIENWADPNHFNPDGSVLLSRWLGEELARELGN